MRSRRERRPLHPTGWETDLKRIATWYDLQSHPKVLELVEGRVKTCRATAAKQGLRCGPNGEEQ